ncbi:DsbA family protein [Streptosporangium pseudovulgare]|uniref:Membrane protein n=1 Tax=Streptosporangium pseudovulgare TaxID=35765 RepID=A0ABQ2QF84_9ACTN|nr:thioredoxin domain-containing protein [Streptosporangium pseudovulgare]GGP78688.1 membrane protein [Streptosporangium pseudovulgare]
MSKSARQGNARERLAEERKRQAARDKQRKLLLGVAGGLVLVSAAVVGFVVVKNNSGDGGDVPKAVAYTGPLAPTTRQEDGSILMSKEGVTGPTLVVFEDFQCPACKSLDEAAGEALMKAAAEGKAKVVYRPFQLFKAPSFAEPLPSVSRRGANAALCAPADKWASYAKTLYTHQPVEGKNGFENAELLSWARDLGFYSADFEKCVTGMEKAADIDKATKYAEEQNVQGTPTLKLNGKDLTQEQVGQIASSPAALDEILAAAGSSPAPSDQ